MRRKSNLQKDFYTPSQLSPEAIHEGQIEHPVECGGIRDRQSPELAGRRAARFDAGHFHPLPSALDDMAIDSILPE